MLAGWARRLLAPLSLRPLTAGGSYATRVLRILRRRAGSMAVFLVVLTLFDVARTWPRDPMSLDVLAQAILRAFPWIMGIVAISGSVLAEATAARGLRLALFMTLLTFTLVGGASVATAALHPGPLPAVVDEGALMSNAAFLFRTWWVYSVAGLLFAAYCRVREREQDVLRVARDAELARADTQREIVASRLKVLQARIEPQLLFDALADVRAAYLVDPTAAEALLDHLVDYLRAALPQMRGGASTLGREAALVEAYLRLVPAGRERRLVIQVTVAPDLAGEDFPPMVLLPLTRAAVDAAASALWIEAPASNGVLDPALRTLALRVSCAGTLDGWREDALEVLRETLRDYLGAGASIEVARTGGAVAALIKWDPESRAPARSARYEAVSSPEIPDSSRAP